MHITFIQTGGTIDKDYPNDNIKHGYGFETGEPAFREIVARIPHLCSFDFLEATQKDGTDLTDGDREIIRRTVEGCPSDRIIVTHGTSTMGKTASALKDIKGKIIVLTGSMLPAKFKGSDAEFNLGMAVGAVQIVPPGVYVALYGRVVPWNEIQNLHDEYDRRAGIR